MKISDFVLLNDEDGYIAQISVTERCGFLHLRKKTTKRRIFKGQSSGLWFFADTGRFTPGFEVEALERAYLAQRNQNSGDKN